MIKFIKKALFNSAWGLPLFWGWNTLYLLVAILGFTPVVMLSLFDAVRVGIVPWQFLGLGALMVLTPVLMMWIGADPLRNNPRMLLKLGYGVEAPLLIVMLVRFFGLREIMPAVGLLLAVGAIGLASMLWALLRPALSSRPLQWLRLIGQTLAVCAAGYVCALLAFYALPALGLMLTPLFAVADAMRDGNLIRNGLGEAFLQTISMLVFAMIGSVFFMFTATLFAVLPVATPLIYLRAIREAWRAVAQHAGRAVATVVCAGVALVLGVVFVRLNQQPQHAAFAALDRATLSTGEAEQLQRQEPALQAGLLNAYLYPYRYLGVVGEVSHVADLYRQSLGFAQPAADTVQRWYDMVARPFLYEPVLERKDELDWRSSVAREDAQRAATLYETYFDQPINRAERAPIADSVRSTWSVDQATSAWQAVDDREVQLITQTLSIVERGGVGEFELYEVYQNVTSLRQEVVYYFSLPESAVITGVWLGESADRATRFPFRVAPRGAAQQIFREQVRRNVDPALVEQVGPRLYRLRVFPIEPARLDWSGRPGQRSLIGAPEAHLWLTWQALPEAGQWALPQLAEKRNVYWTDATTRSINGAPIKGEPWLPLRVPVTLPQPALRASWVFSGGMQVSVAPAEVTGWQNDARGLKLAVVLDRTRSMASQTDAVARALARLRELGIGGADLILSSSPLRGEPAQLLPLDASFDPRNERYVGNDVPASLINQFASLAAGRRYDGVLVLTDRGGYENGEAPVIKVPDAPVWMLHFGGFPLAYTDAHLTAVNASGGGAVDDIDAALQRMVLARRATPGVQQDWEAGLIWRVERSTAASDTAAAGASIAARRVVLAELQRNRGNTSELGMLDRLHALAKAQAIVTPYSSMIVLVNEAQRQRLNELEQGADRFEREAEQVGETDAQVTGVPEPHEWLLLLLGAAALVYMARRRRLAVA